MSPRTWDKLAIGSWYIGVGAFAVTVVLTIVMLVRFPELTPFSSWIGSEPEITVTGEPEITVTGEPEVTVAVEYGDITFLEMEKLIQSTEGLTTIQAEALGSRWEGQRLIWDGFMHNVYSSVSNEYVLDFEPRQQKSHIGRIWAQAYFDGEGKEVLLQLRIGQKLRLDCEFEHILQGDNPILRDCHFVDTIPQPVGPITTPEKPGKEV